MMYVYCDFLYFANNQAKNIGRKNILYAEKHLFLQRITIETFIKT